MLQVKVVKAQISQLGMKFWSLRHEYMQDQSKFQPNDVSMGRYTRSSTRIGISWNWSIQFCNKIIIKIGQITLASTEPYSVLWRIGCIVFWRKSLWFLIQFKTCVKYHSGWKKDGTHSMNNVYYNCHDLHVWYLITTKSHQMIN